MTRATGSCDEYSVLAAHAGAAIWGAAEATFFFVVPDVWISRVALRRPALALGTTVSAVAGAVAGGLVTRAWAGRFPPADSEAALVRLPAVSRTMVRGVEEDLRRDGLRAMLLGPTRGVPYKLYARAAGVGRVPAGAFAAWSVPARLPRFVLLAVVPAVLAALGRRIGMGRKEIDIAHGVAWTAFYTWFFRTVGRDDGASVLTLDAQHSPD